MKNSLMAIVLTSVDTDTDKMHTQTRDTNFLKNWDTRALQRETEISTNNIKIM